jgi:hypothetical protein
MIKSLLTLASVTVVSVALNAQTGKIAKPGNILANTNQPAAQVLAATCNTLTTLTGTSVSVYTASSDSVTLGCSPNAGYVFGTNCYGDKEKANFFAAGTYSSLSSPSVSAIMATFFQSGTMGTGGTSSVSANMKVYAGTLAGGPTTVVTTANANLGQIVAAHTNTASPIFVFTYTFATPVAIPASGFFTSLVLPNTAGDTAVVANDPNAPVDVVWEYEASNTWSAVSTSWSGLKGSLAILPVVCGSTVTTGVSANGALSKQITLMPNPSAGVVNISVSSSLEQNLNVTVTNALGQVVKSASFEGITYNVLPLNLTEQPNGIYFVAINNGKEKFIQRLIINK